ncbi:MAG: cyclic-di-AMP receptor, partial [Defluviitaleaceae bacterium]|nr:cyclic-di-AMP receptor [Defluviitaleaceae bacterium]
MDKLIMAIIHDEDAFQIIDVLSEEGFKVTKLASTGGFLRAG